MVLVRSLETYAAIDTSVLVFFSLFTIFFSISSIAIAFHYFITYCLAVVSTQMNRTGQPISYIITPSEKPAQLAISSNKKCYQNVYHIKKGIINTINISS